MAVTTENSTCVDVQCSIASATPFNSFNHWSRPYDSFRFTQLRKISWRGHRNAKSQALGKILRASAHLLEQAEIGYVAPHSLRWFLVTHDNYFVYKHLKPDEQCVFFSSLRKLSLSGITFVHGMNDILFAFNFSQLRSLKLRDCLGTNELLKALASSSQALRLISFELNFTGIYIEQRDLMPLVRFLLSFEGLKDLYILFPAHAHLIEEYWHSITHHMSTLERVVHHLGTTDNPEYVPSGDGHGLVGALLARANLECLGICFLPDELVSKQLLSACGRDFMLITFVSFEDFFHGPTQPSAQSQTSSH